MQEITNIQKMEEKPSDINMEHARKIFMDSMKYWQNSIEDYKKMIAENNSKIDSPRTSESKKKAFRLLNEVCKKEIENCQKQIEKLLNE